MSDERLVSIYGLVDPRTACLRYVGSSIHPEKRRREHIAAVRGDGTLRRQNPLVLWLTELADADLEPELVILQVVPQSGVKEAEERWIAAYRAADVDLCNTLTVVNATTNAGKKIAVGQRVAIPQRSEPRPREHLAAEEIVAYRERFHLSQWELSYLLGVHDSTISRWENGSRAVPARVRIALDALAERLSIRGENG